MTEDEDREEGENHAENYIGLKFPINEEYPRQ